MKTILVTVLLIFLAGCAFPNNPPKYKPSTIVQLCLTGDVVMILDYLGIPGNVWQYEARRKSNFEIITVSEHELCDVIQ